MCTVDGAVFKYGDTDLPFTLQQCSYPINYALCAEQLGLRTVAEFVGTETPTTNDAFALSAETKPFNPLTLTGALAVCGHLYPEYVLCGEMGEKVRSNQYMCASRDAPSARILKCLEAYTELSSPPQLPFNGATLSVSMPAYLAVAQDTDNKYSSPLMSSFADVFTLVLP